MSQHPWWLCVCAPTRLHGHWQLIIDPQQQDHPALRLCLVNGMRTQNSGLTGAGTQLMIGCCRYKVVSAGDHQSLLGNCPMLGSIRMISDVDNFHKLG
jgi:hypothetical protein